MIKVLNRVNLGCGMTPTYGWSNFDNSLSVRASKLPLHMIAFAHRFGIINDPTLKYIYFCREHDIEYCDATKKIPRDDNSIEVLYSSHMLEHLDRQEAGDFLREAFRVLASKGIIRIAVPGVSAKINKYLSDGDADQLIESLRTCNGKPRSWLDRLRLAIVGPRHHHWMYDEKSLCRLLEKAGFHDAKALPAGETMILSPGNLNLAERAEESIFVEAVK